MQPLLTRTQFSPTEFEVYADFQVRLALKKEEPEGALSWLTLWGQILPESPKREGWQSTAEMLPLFVRLKSMPQRKRKPKGIPPAP